METLQVSFALIVILVAMSSPGTSQDNNTCADNEFYCYVSAELSSTRNPCIPAAYRCDGQGDCPQNEDEQGCDLPCADGGFRCYDSTCIPQHFRCDWIPDCADADDEANCTYPACADDEFTCDNGRCVRTSLTCNGNWDCGDGSDEADSLCVEPVRQCPNGQFTCRNHECIDEDLICDGNEDCADRSDEIYCNVNECANTTHTVCSQRCFDTAAGYMCRCNEGYRLMDDESTCESINECEETPLVCDQLCENYSVGYNCSCAEGYTLADDARTCTANPDSDDAFLVLANKYTIRKIALNGTQLDILLSDTELVHILDFDSVGRHIYYADALGRHIRRINYDHDETQEPVTIVWHNLPLIEGIAVDWLGRKLYWTDSSKKALLVSELNGTFVRTLLDHSTERPRAITVHPRLGWLFWTDWFSPPFIGRMGMDGSGFKKIITDDLFWPNGITADTIVDKIWWADAYLDRVEYSDLDGTNRYVVLEDTPHVYAITVFEHWVFLSDWNIKALERANRFSGGNRTNIMTLSTEPFDIHVVHPGLQPPGTNPCGTENGNCSHLCLISPGGSSYTCACPDDFTLLPDARTCDASCSAAQFLCSPTDHRCIPATWRCDGEVDCVGGNDEAGCPNRTCAAGLFQCADGDGCTYYTDVCDGTLHCDDASDENEAFCMSRVCLDTQFLCNDTGRCISDAWLCDGAVDCLDGADERDCEQTSSCESNEFTCDNGECIPETWWCDLDVDCDDGSDESNRTACWDKPCPDGWQRCPHHYRCIPKSLFCDHHDDCRDGSDEPQNRTLCPPCPAGEYRCNSGQCIPNRWKCDFDFDCDDRSDEGPENCDDDDYPACEESQFRCNSSRCIRESYVCNGDNDCRDNSDEDAHICRDRPCHYEGDFRCTSGHCIMDIYRCDRDFDCEDGSDEFGCPETDCYSWEFQCNNSACIPLSWRCDTDNDCFDNSDEKLSVCHSISCTSYSRFPCDNGRCLRWTDVCDGVAQCEDSSDENYFNRCQVEEYCNGEEFRCHDDQKTCIPTSQVCDMYGDCPNQMDETLCSHGNTSHPQLCTSSSCTQTCVNVEETQGHYCMCEDGYQPDPEDRTRCLDIDECASWGSYCPQDCTNLRGGRVCTCQYNFEVEDSQGDHPMCIPPGALKGNLLVGHDNTIRSLSMDRNWYDTGITYGDKIYRLTVDPTMVLAFWTDDSKQAIYRGKMAQSQGTVGVAQSIITGLEKPSGVAVDWVARNLYYTDMQSGTIAVAKYDGRYRKTLLSGLPSRKPTYIVVNPQTGHMFWCDPVSEKIMTAWMDGQNEAVLVSTNIVEPTGIAIDYFMNSRIFWADGKKNTIESCNWDGSDRAVVLDHDLQKPYGLDVMFGHMYWIDGVNNNVYQMDKFGRGVNVTLLSGSRPHDITLQHLWKYPPTPSPNPCDFNACHPLCLIVPYGHKCECPDGAVFMPGSVTQCRDENADMDANGSYPPLPEVLERTMVITCPCTNDTLCEGVLFEEIPPCECRTGWVHASCRTDTELSTVSPSATTTPRAVSSHTEPSTSSTTSTTTSTTTLSTTLSGSASTPSTTPFASTARAPTATLPPSTTSTVPSTTSTASASSTATSTTPAASTSTASSTTTSCPCKDASLCATGNPCQCIEGRQDNICIAPPAGPASQQSNLKATITISVIVAVVCILLIVAVVVILYRKGVFKGHGFRSRDSGTVGFSALNEEVATNFSNPLYDHPEPDLDMKGLPADYNMDFSTKA